MKKFVTILFTVLFFVAATIVAIPFLFKDKIVDLIKQQANQNLNAVVNFDNNIGLNIIRSFPNLSLTIHNLSVTGINDFKNDTLIALKEFNATLDLMSVINGDQISIINISLVEPKLLAIVLKDGKANWDIAKTTDTTTTQPDTAKTAFKVKLKKLNIKDAAITYNDLQAGVFTQINKLTYNLTGDFTQDNFTMQNLLNIAGITVSMGGINYLTDADMSLNADIDADMPNMKFVFKENTFILNTLKLAFNGRIAMPKEDIDLDLTFAVKENSFKDFLSLVPAVYKSDLNALQAKGNLGFEGYVKGIYNQKNMPAFGLNLHIADGWFKYTDMPAPLEAVNIALNINKPDGDIDRTHINLSRCDFNLQKNPFSMLLQVSTPISNPFIDFAAKGKIDFNHIKSLIPLENGTELAGIINTDITAKGYISDLEKKQFNKFNASGRINIQKLFYNSKDLPKPFSMPVASMDINPDVFNLHLLQVNIGQSDFDLNGKVSNFLPYLFNKGELEATLNLVSNQINANEFLTDNGSAPAEAVEDTSTLTVFEVPENLNIIFNSRINKLVYTNMLINDFTGTVTLRNKQISFNNVSLQTLGSSIKMNGFYNTENVAEPKVNFNFNIANLDIQQAFKTFNTIQKIAPAAEKIAGIFNMNFNMQTLLTQNMQPNLTTMFATGLLNIPKAEINNLTTFSRIADALNKPEFKQGTISNALINFKVEDGRITTQPFDILLAGKKVNLSGSSGLDQTIDYIGKTNLKRSELGAANTAINSALAQLNEKLGSNINMSQDIPIGLTITGTFTNPKIGTNIGNIVKDEAKKIGNQLADEAAKRKAELEAKARAEADRLKNEAEEKARQAKAEAEAKARAEADRLKREAEEKANAEKERLKKQAEEEAKKRLRKVF
ncbi:MAG: hypothetical protein ACK4K9_00510 [Bacteroidia bacterium]